MTRLLSGGARSRITCATASATVRAQFYVRAENVTRQPRAGDTCRTGTERILVKVCIVF
jgi:hypothetical protein